MHEEVGAQSDRNKPLINLGEAAFAGSVQYCMDTLRSAQELDFATQDALIADTAAGLNAEALLMEEPQDPDLISQAICGRNARVQLAVSFSKRVVNIVLGNCRRVGVWTDDFQEETLQAGMLGLAESIVGFAKISEDERGGFWAYAQKVVINRIRKATREDYLRHPVTKKDEQLTARLSLGKYLAARNAFIDQHRRPPSDAEIAGVMATTIGYAYTLRQVGSRTLFIAQGANNEEN
jgi:hypothetical protein